MGDKIKLRRGLKAGLPTLDDGEFGFATDTNQTYIGNSGTNVLMTNPQASVFEVSANGPYTTVSAAITAAVAWQGATANASNPAFVKINPGIYNESLTLKPGVHLIGKGSEVANGASAATTGVITSDVVINGNHTYAQNTAFSNAAASTVIIRAVNLSVLNGVTLTISGTGQARVNFYESTVQKQSGGDVNSAVNITSTNGATRVRFLDSSIAHDVAGSDACQIGVGTLEFRGRLSSVFNAGTTAVTLASAIKVNGAATLNIVSGSFASGPFTQIFNIQNAGAAVAVDASNLQNTLASTPASGTITVANQPSAGDTITLNGWVYTAVTSGNVAGYSYLIGANTSATATNIAATINSHAGVTSASVTTNVVTVKSATTGAPTVSTVPSSISNAMNLLTSNPTAFTLSGSTLTGGLDGGYIVNFTANGILRLRRSGVFLNDGGCKVANGSLGQLQENACSYGGIPGLNGANNWVDTGISIFENPSLLRRDNANRVYVGNSRGFSTIQSAINWISTNSINGPGRKTVVIQPGFYTENLVLADNVDLCAGIEESNNNLQSNGCQIVGKHTWASSAIGASIQITGLVFQNQNVGGPTITMSGTNSNPSLLMKNCGLFNKFNDVNSMFSITHTNFPKVILKDCVAYFINDFAPALFDFSASQNGHLVLDGILGDNFSEYGVESNLAGTTATAFVKSGPGFSADIKRINIFLGSDVGFLINDSSAFFNISSVKMDQNTNVGQMFKFGSNGNVNLTNCSINQSGLGGVGGRPMIARDGGVQGSGTFTVTGTTTGESIVVNGVTFTEGVDFTDAALTSDTAINIGNAINSSVNVGVNNIVYATVSGSVVTVYAYNTGTAGNYTLTGSADISAVTMSGGTDGSGGTLGYGACSFGFNYYQSTLNVFQNSTTLVSI